MADSDSTGHGTLLCGTPGNTRVEGEIITDERKRVDFSCARVGRRLDKSESTPLHGTEGASTALTTS